MNKQEKAPLVPGFVADPSMEVVVRQFNDVARRKIGLVIDGASQTELDEANARIRQAATGDAAKKMRQYLQPYLEKELPKGDATVLLEEHERWYAAGVLQGLDKKTGEAK